MRACASGDVELKIWQQHRVWSTERQAKVSCREPARLITIGVPTRHYVTSAIGDELGLRVSVEDRLGSWLPQASFEHLDLMRLPIHKPLDFEVHIDGLRYCCKFRPEPESDF